MIEQRHPTGNETNSHSNQAPLFPDLGGLKDPALETLMGTVTEALRITMVTLDKQRQLTNEELERPLLEIFRSRMPHHEGILSDSAFEGLAASVVTQSPDYQGFSKSEKADLLRRATARLETYTGRRLYTVPREGPFYAPIEFIRDPGAVFPVHDWQKQPIRATELGDLHITISEDRVELTEAQRVHIFLAGDDKEPIAYGEFQVMRGEFRGSAAESKFLMAAEEIGRSVAVSACDLVAQYSAADIFREGDLVMLEAFEVAEERRGESLGVQFLEHALTYLKRCWPTLRSLSVCSEPYQFLYAPPYFRPENIKIARDKDRRALEQHWEAQKECVLRKLSDAIAPAKGYLFSDRAASEAAAILG